MRADLVLVRPERPSLFTDLRTVEGAREVYEHLCRNVLFDRADARS
jgi:urease accessory protein